MKKKSLSSVEFLTLFFLVPQIFFLTQKMRFFSSGPLTRSHATLTSIQCYFGAGSVFEEDNLNGMVGRKRKIKPNFKPPAWFEGSDSDSNSDANGSPKRQRLHDREDREPRELPPNQRCPDRENRELPCRENREPPDREPHPVDQSPDRELPQLTPQDVNESVNI